jgi:hypothetical protein
MISTIWLHGKGKNYGDVKVMVAGDSGVGRIGGAEDF